MKYLRVAFLSLLLLTTIASLAAESGQTFETAGVTIWYEVKGGGSGTPLIIVNGGPGFDHSYVHLGDPVWNPLSQDRPVVFYDQRGNGRSSALKAGQSCTLADQIDDLEALRVHLGAERVDILGHSWGGYLVMAYTARHPDRVRRLIIVDSAAPKFSDTKFLFREIFPETVAKQDGLDFADALGDKKANDESLKLYFSMLFYSAEKRDIAVRALQNADFHKAVNESIVGDLARFDLNPELLKLDLPTLVVTGRYDINVAPSVAWKIHQQIRGSSFVVFERSGHIPYYEEPEAFLKTVGTFLK